MHAGENRQDEPGGETPGGHDRRAPQRNRARRHRTIALARMGAVGRQIEEIVQDVDARGDHAEGQEGDEAEGERPLVELVRGDHRQEDQQVLHPLVRPQRFQVRLEADRRRFDECDLVRAAPQSLHETGGRIDCDRMPRRAKGGERRLTAPHVIVAATSEKLRKARSPALTLRQSADRVVANIERSGERARDRLRRVRDEDDAPTLEPP